MKLFAKMTMYLIPSMNFAIGPPLPLSGIQQIFGGRGLRVWVLRWVLGKHAAQSVETGSLTSYSSGTNQQKTKLLQ